MFGLFSLNASPKNSYKFVCWLWFILFPSLVQALPKKIPSDSLPPTWKASPVLAPSVITLNPAAAARNVPRSASISIEFSEAMNVTTINAQNIYIYGSATGIVQGGFNNPTGNTFVFVPNQALRAGEVIRVSISNRVESAIGEALPQTFNYEFHVASAQAFPVFSENNLGSSANRPNHIFASDLDQDGDTDFYTSSFQDGQIIWYENDGSQNFTENQIAAGAGAGTVRTADLNGDGNLDIIATFFLEDRLVWYENDGNQNFVERAIREGLDQVFVAYAVDLDGDGREDVLSATINGTAEQITWHRNEGGGNFTDIVVASGIQSTQQLAAADLDGDGDLDVVAAAERDNAVFWYENQNQTSFTQRLVTNNAVRAYGVETLDMDQDGDMDIVSVALENNILAWHENDGGGNFTERIIRDNLPDPTALSVNDLDGDGDADIVIASADANQVLWFENDGTQLFTERFIPTNNNATRWVHMADVDSDQDLDILTTSTQANKVLWFENTGSIINRVSPLPNAFDVSPLSNIEITFSATIDPSTINGSLQVRSEQRGLIAGNLTLSGGNVLVFDPDENFRAGEILQVTLRTSIRSNEGTSPSGPYSYQLQVGANAGVTSFVEQPPLPAPTDGPTFVGAADLDKDGDLDLLAASKDGNRVSWYENDGNENFLENVISDTISRPQEVRAVDLDNDLDLDVVAVSPATDRLVWFENQGGQVFGIAQDISNQATGIRQFVSIDLDGDGDMDIIAPSEFGDAISWYMNDGFQNFTENLISNQTIRPQSVYAADLDADGDLDVVAGGRDGERIVWFENDGTQNFTNRIINQDNGSFEAISVYAVDVDADGDLDITVASQPESSFDMGKVAWYENQGQGNFGSEQIISDQTVRARYVYAADIDGDGDMDVLSASDFQNKIAWHENLGEQQFVDREISTNATLAQAVYAADVDTDGDLDLLSASRNDDKVTWYKNESLFGIALLNPNTHAFDVAVDSSLEITFTGEIDPSTVNADNIQVMSLITGTVDGSYQVNANQVTFTPNQPFEAGEVIRVNIRNTISSMNGSTLLRSFSYEFTTAVSPNLGAFNEITPVTEDIEDPFAIHAADLDEDGDIDIFTASPADNTVAWYENDGNLNYTKRIVSDQRQQPRSVYVADMDGDGDLDVLSASQADNSVAWHENDGNQNFTDREISTNAQGALFVLAYDVDGDGDLDVLSASRIDNKIAWYENDGAQNFTEIIVDNTVSQARQVHATDMDLDGDIDLLSVGGSNNTIAWYENDGNQNFTRRVIITTALSPISIYTGDLDGDGDVDISTSSLIDGKIAWFENDGNQNFSENQLSTDFDNAQAASMVDIDGDGDIDILAASFSRFRVAWFENDGNQNFKEQLISDNTLNVEIVHFMDIDRDGDIDVLAGAAGGDDKIAIFLNTLEPPALSACTISKNEIQLAWDDQNDSTRNYVLERSEGDNSNFMLLTEVEATQRTFLDQTVLPNTTYFYRVQAINNNEQSRFSNEKMAGTYLPPGSGQALLFDGNNDHLNLTPYLEELTNFSEGTFTGWFNTSSTNTQALLTITTESASIVDRLEIILNNSNGFITDESFAVSLSRDGVNLLNMFVLNGDGAYADGEWHHFAVVMGGNGNNGILIDGVPQSIFFQTGNNETPGFTDLPAATQFRIANRRFTSDDAHFQGQMDELALWNKQLTADEVRNIMCSKLACDENGLVAYWRFDEGQGDISQSQVGIFDAFLSNFDFTTSSGWLTSGAPIGDVSIFDYNTPLSLTLDDPANSESVTIDQVQGNPAGIHLYRVNEAPNVKEFSNESVLLDTLRYWGTFVSGGNTPNYRLSYSYGGSSLDGDIKEPATSLISRSGNASLDWLNENATLNINTNTLIADNLTPDQNTTEYIIGFAAPFLINTLPSPNESQADTLGDLSFNFSQNMTALTASDQVIRIHGGFTGMLSTQNNFNGANTPNLGFNPPLDLQPGELVTVMMNQQASSEDGVNIISPKVYTFNAGVSDRGAGRFTIENIISEEAAGVTDIFLGDLDGDGDLDIFAVLSTGNAVLVYKNDGQGNFTEQSIDDNFNGVSSIYAGDLDNDGDLDLVAASSNTGQIRWYRNESGTDFTAIPISSDLSDISSLYITDLDGDINLDILAASFNQDQIVWYANGGSGNFAPARIISQTANGVSEILAADLDGDLHQDVLAVFSNADQVVWFENDNFGNFSPAQIIADDALAASSILATDLDGDLDLDVSYASAGNDRVVWYENLGSGSFSPARSSFNSDGIADITSADVNGDGILELILTAVNNRKVSWLGLDNTGNFGAENIVSEIAQGVTKMRTADLDGDGDLEIITAAPSENKIAWFRNDGSALALPGILELTVVSNEQIDLEWEDNANDENFYEIQRSIDGGEFVFLDTVSQNVTTFRDPGVTTDVEYCYRVRAVNAFSSSDFSNVACDTIKAVVVPVSPSDLEARVEVIPGNPITVILDWEDNSDTEQRFVLERSINNAPFVSLEDTDIDFNTTSFTDRLIGLQVPPSQLICYRIRARNEAGDSDPSNEVCVLVGPPSFGISLTATATSSSTVRLDWELSEPIAFSVRYRVEREINGVFTEIATTDFDTLSYLDTELISNIEYCYRVRAFNDFGASGYSNVACATPVANVILLPNLFTPNQDGNNDRFILRSRNVSAAFIKVFDRFGNIVYETNQASEATELGWDGGESPNGTYVWSARVTFVDGDVQAATGKVNLLR